MNDENDADPARFGVARFGYSCETDVIVLKRNVKWLALFVCAVMLIGSLTLSALADGNTGSTGEEPGDNNAAFTHTLEHHAAAEPTWNTAGNIEYWSCTHCVMMFADENAEVMIVPQEITIRAMDADHDRSVSPADAAVYLTRGQDVDAAAVLQKCVGLTPGFSSGSGDDGEWSPYV